MALYIVAKGSYCENVGEELPSLKPLVKEVIGHSVQRIRRFTQLALIGAGRAADQVAENSSVYLSSGSGDMGAMVEVMDSIFRHRQGARPLSFVNSVSNAACFHVVRALGLVGSSLFIGSRYFSFEMAIKSAALDIEAGKVCSALVGVVDVVVDPVEDHRKRLGLDASSALAEGSHWLQLVGVCPDERPVLASLEPVHQFSDRGSLSEWLSQQNFVDASLSVGQHLTAQEGEAWQNETGLQLFEHRAGVGHFESKAGLFLAEFIERGEGTLLYLNGDPHGRYVAIVIHKA